ncbi:MAG: MCE family protein [Ignavibacteriales bacterium]|nr:MCE family protein [Ignavibacteriales bacterium]MCB9209836.1 MCE family protein [Ignavibacteriales bacterium]
MNSEKKTEIKVGLTVLMAILIFIFIFSWAKNFNLDSNNNLLTVQFATVAGLEIGDLVSVNGVRKGLVDAIFSTNNNNATVKIKFTENVNLKEDATFSIMMLDLMGGKKIEINSGNSDVLLDYEKTQIGKFSGDISTAMATLSSVESDLVEVIGELKITLRSANSIIGNQEFTEKIKNSVIQLTNLSENLNSLVVSNKEVISTTLQNAKELTDKTNVLLENNSEKITSVLTNLNSTLNSSNELILQLTQLSDETRNSQNNLGKILYDENLVNDLKTSLSQIKELTEIINSQLKSGGLEVKADVDLF